MTRRSWRDLERRQGAEAPGPQLPGFGPGQGGDLRAAAGMAQSGRLTALLDQREALEQRIRALSSGGGAPQDPAVAARFPVQSFAERRAEQDAFEARRAQLRAQQDEIRRGLRAGEEGLPQLPGLADTPLAQRMGAGLPGPGGTGLGGPRSGIGQAVGGMAAGLRGESQRRRAEILGPARRAGAALEEAGRPLRQIGSQLENARGQMRDLDRQLASEGVSEAERAEIRRQMGGDTIEKVAGPISKANEALSRPARLADGVGRNWEARERQLTAPMDRTSRYAEMRERRLSTETGGSGDLFERMRRNRERALARRREAEAEEARDRRRRERAAERGRERRAEERGEGRGRT
ncbi:hypothetical protein [Mangrovicoccus sp. HB161399]|uniref:hypothetical protein n=1 Tax=Mangrovicoccus sp. HB161399 TaxID=2720392 RepID=UPI00155553BE|nr:hypothetical protein [Mangrovicoccus sp. HB161399]